MQVASSLPEVCGHCSSRSFKRSSLHRWLDVDVEVDIVVSRGSKKTTDWMSFWTSMSRRVGDHRLDVKVDVETEVETDIARAALPELWQTA